MKAEKNAKKGPQKTGLRIDLNILNQEKRIEEALGLKINIQNKSNNSGKVIIHYTDLEQFDFISNLLKKH